MGRAKKNTKKPAPKEKGNNRAKSAEAYTPRFGHLIRIPDKEARLRAIMVLGTVPVPHCGFTDYRFLVLNAHIEALRKEGIPFEILV
ncbi:MAG: hypothetical protein L0Z62_48995 [Gemmataceae bacterium]|nr:hypothetical protein [Gemmataceae bacterium]